MRPEPDVRLRRLARGLAHGPGALDEATRGRALRLEPLPEPLGGFVAKLSRPGQEVTGNDVERLRDAGYSQDQVIELAVCAALGLAQARLKAGLVALEEAEAW